MEWYHDARSQWTSPRWLQHGVHPAFHSGLQTLSLIFNLKIFTNRRFGIATFAEAKASVSRQKAGVLWEKTPSEKRIPFRPPLPKDRSASCGALTRPWLEVLSNSLLQPSLTKANEFLGSALTMVFGQWGHQVPCSPCWLSQTCTSIREAPRWHFYDMTYLYIYISPVLQADPVACDNYSAGFL